jgi:hypothetical protein
MVSGWPCVVRPGGLHGRRPALRLVTESWPDHVLLDTSPDAITTAGALLRAGSHNSADKDEARTVWRLDLTVS